MNMDQKDVANQISAEVWRVVSSPYPVSLKILDNILSLDKDGQAFDEFATSNPCKIGRLVSCVLDTVELRPFAINLLGHLCRCDFFREQMLQSRPELLDILLSQASRGNKQYTTLCVRILRHKLPETVALPAAAESFFIDLIMEAIRSPDATTLAAAYDLLSGACNHLPQMLPQKEWSKLECELIKIVKSSRTIQDQSLSLLCLGILQVLAFQPAQEERKNNLDARAFFAGTKSLKSLSLAVLQAAWVTKPTHDAVKADVQRSLHINLNIVDAIPVETLEAWSRSPEGHGAITRIASQCCDPKIDIDIRLQLFLLLARFFHPNAIPMKFVNQIDGFLENHEYLFASRTVLEQTLEAVLPTLLESPNSTTVTRILTSISRTSSYGCFAIENIRTLLNSVTTITTGNAALANLVQRELHAIDESIIDMILSHESSTLTCNGPQDCQANLLTMKHKLAEEVASLWLAVMATSSSMDHSKARIGTSIKMVEFLRTKVWQTKHECHSPHVMPKPRMTLIEQQSSNDMLERVSWKERIRAFATQHSTWQEQRLIEVFGDMCVDLEDRCENAEKPFRKAEAQVQALAAQVADLERRNSELEQNIMDLNLGLRTAEAEKAEIHGTLQPENERLIGRVLALEQNLKQSEDAFQIQIESREDMHNSKQLALRTTITEKELLLDEAASRCEEMQQLHSSVEIKLQDMEQQLADYINKEDALKVKLDDKMNELRQLTDTNQSMGQNIQELLCLQQDAATSLNKLRGDLENAHNNAQQASMNHRSEIAALESRVQQEVSEHAAAIEQMQKELITEKQAFMERETQLLLSLEAEKAENHDFRQRTDRLNAEKHDQQQQIEQLQGTIAAKDDEIAGFLPIKQTLATAFGQMNERKHPRKSVHYAPAVVRSPTGRRQSRRLTDRTATSPSKSTGTIIHDAVNLKPVDLSFESVSTESGSTPKRAKPQRSIKVPVVRQPHLHVTATPKSTKMRSQRQPLTDISTGRGNMSPSRLAVSAKKPGLGKGYPDLNFDGAVELEDLDFGSETFTSTPFTPQVPRDIDCTSEDETVDE